jgi:hypothetical protein
MKHPIRSRRAVLAPFAIVGVLCAPAFADGSHRDIRVPVKAWRFGATPKIVPDTTRRIAKLARDPEHTLPGADRSDDRYTID